MRFGICILLTISVLKKKLMNIDVRHAKLLCDSLISGTDKQFGSMFVDNEFPLASVAHSVY